jgi:hypothetical protein
VGEVIKQFPLFRWEMAQDGTWEAYFVDRYGYSLKYVPREPSKRGDYSQVVSDLRMLQRKLSAEEFDPSMLTSGGIVCVV